MICVFVHGHGRGRMKTLPSLWTSRKHECCSCKIHISDQRGERLLCWIINKSSLPITTTAGFCTCVLLTPSVFIGLFIAEAPVSKSGQGYSGAPRIQRQEQVIHLSPKKGSQVRLYTCLTLFTYTIRTLTVQFNCSVTLFFQVLGLRWLIVSFI